MTITVNGTTNTLTAASGLTIAGNTAVTGTLSATGAITSNDGTVAMRAIGFVDTGYIGTTSNHPVAIQVNNSTIAAVTSSGLAVTGTLSSTGSMSVVPTTGTNPAWLFFKNDSGAANSYIGQDGSVAGLDTAYSLNVWNGSNTPIIFGVNNAKVGSWTSTGLAVTGQIASTNVITQTIASGSQALLTLQDSDSRSLLVKGPTAVLDAALETGSNHPLTVGAATSVTVQVGSVGSRSTIGTFSSTALTLGASVKLLPTTDNTQDIGAAATGFKEIFADNGTINTSDARRKTEVYALSAAEINAAKQLAKEIGSFKFLAAVAEKGDAARNHIGMTVQRAIAIMEGNGLDPFAYSFICHDVWDDEFVEHPAIEAVSAKEAVIDEDGNVVTPAVEAVAAVDAWTEQTKVAGDKYSFRVHELLLFMAAGFEARLAALEAA